MVSMSRPNLTMIGSLSAQGRRGLEAAYDDVQERLKVVLRGGRCLAGFFLDIASLQWRRIVNSHSIIDAVARLEGDLSRDRSVKPPTRYKGSHLRGLWHAHFLDARFLVENFCIENSVKRLNKIMEPHFGKTMGEVAPLLAHEMIIGAYERRASRRSLTGECIIFEATPTHNRYLTVRWHKEDDLEVRDRIRQYRDFEPDSIPER